MTDQTKPAAEQAPSPSPVFKSAAEGGGPCAPSQSVVVEATPEQASDDWAPGMEGIC